LLAFSRQQVLQPRVINIGEHIRSIEDLLRRVLGEDIRVSIDVGKHPIHLREDPAQLEQVIMNLVVNARDAMPFGGRLSIEVSDVTLDEEYCSRNFEARPGRYVGIAIGDTGSGMAPEVQARLFEPFFTTKEAGKGTGLGLATVYGIVKQSGGHITVYSEVNQGTTFKVHFPLSLDSEPVSEAPAMVYTVPRGSETILLVEDEEAMRQLAAAYLEGKGYVVLPAADPEAAIAIASEHPDAIHLLLTDVILPGMSGVKLAERISASRQNLRVLYVSGYTADAIVHHGGQGPNFAFLSKPFALSSLARKVRSVLDETLADSEKRAYTQTSGPH
jgi:two-component system cell cycle sensor histidine kinase/response regulator CckA